MEFDIKRLKVFNYNKLVDNPKYSLILIGALPHSTKCIGDSTSPIIYLQENVCFAKVVLLKDCCDNGSPKITKTSLENALINYLDDKKEALAKQKVKKREE